MSHDIYLKCKGILLLVSSREKLWVLIGLIDFVVYPTVYTADGILRRGQKPIKKRSDSEVPLLLCDIEHVSIL